MDDPVRLAWAGAVVVGLVATGAAAMASGPSTGASGRHHTAAAAAGQYFLANRHFITDARHKDNVTQYDVVQTGPVAILPRTRTAARAGSVSCQ
ncbi:MAG: hypothetical protein WA777_06475 [Rhodanobacter sp.]